MKKQLLLISFVLALSTLHAQNGNLKSDMYEIMAHRISEYDGFNIENFMRQHDGDFVYCTFVSNEGPNPYQQIGVGNMLYKMSPTTLTITDSLFVEDPEAPYYLFAQNPTGEGNIRANFEYVEACDSTFLRICHFPDNSLQINHDDDIIVPVCTGLAGSNFDSHMIDCRGDLIMKYTSISPNGSYNENMVRFGPDGTLKHQAVLVENQTAVVPKLRLFSESPLQYYQWKGGSDGNLDIWLIDSLFQKSTITINKMLSEEIVDPEIGPYIIAYEYLNFNVDTEVIPVGDNEILVATPYTQDTNYDVLHAEHGIAVLKYDIQTMQRKGLVVFNDYPGPDTDSDCLGLKKMSDGTVYLLYRDKGYPENSFIVVKMGTNLFVEWKRFCKTNDIILDLGLPLYFPTPYEDEQGEEQGIAWAGYARNANDELQLVYFLLNHDGIPASVKNYIEVRPYAFYPNPVRDQLRLQYSPDVEPRQIELYDLQGRLVHSQSNALESLNLQGLAAGQYVMKVTMEDGKTFSDKVVKE